MSNNLAHHFGTLVRCEDPHDIRPVVDAVMAEVQAIADTLTPSPKQPIAILIGQQHDSEIHHMLVQGLLGRLMDHPLTQGGDNLTFNYELPHNIGFVMARNHALKIMTSDRFLAGDPAEDERTLKLVMRYYAATDEPATFNNLLAFCLVNRISTRFQDAAMIHRPGKGNTLYLDQDDPKARQVITEFMPDLLDIPLSAVSVPGMLVRNMLMVQGALAHAVDKDSPILVLASGSSHILGHGKTADHGFFGSETHLFYIRGGYPIPVVIPDLYKVEYIPPEAQQFLGFGILVDGLSQESVLNMFTRTGKLDRKRETQFMEKVDRASGGTVGTFKNVPRLLRALT